MKGASLVGGTEGATIENAPDNVGRLDGRPVSVLVVDAPVMVGIDCVFVPVVPEPVITTFEAVPVSVAFADPVFVAVAEVFPPAFDVCVAIERFGRAESVAAADCATAPIVRREIARAVERTGVFRRSLMMNILSNYYAKR